MILLLDNPLHVHQQPNGAPEMISFRPRLRGEGTLRCSTGDLIEAVSVNLTVKTSEDAKPSLDFFWGEDNSDLDHCFDEEDVVADLCFEKDGAEKPLRAYYDIVIPLSAERFMQVLSMVPHGVSGQLVVALVNSRSAVIACISDAQESYVWDVARIESLDISGSVLSLSFEWPQ